MDRVAAAVAATTRKLDRVAARKEFEALLVEPPHAQRLAQQAAEGGRITPQEAATLINISRTYPSRTAAEKFVLWQATHELAAKEPSLRVWPMPLIFG